VVEQRTEHELAVSALGASTKSVCAGDREQS
jgi:hypothetical protein